MKMLVAVLVLAATPAAASVQSERRASGETTIPLNRSGGIRSYVVDHGDHRIVHMQDQRQRWYRVTLSGECLPADGQAALITRTRFDSRLDRQSTVASNRYPGRVCGIDSIVHAAPPPGTPGAARRP
ncbi:hypothetical protein SAMN06297144_1588 [Sphingomonas guangdongensis]|uniref:SH3 domain-containing protein n=1 Tax=Sphingomonas guangdongensis TaxID=1141890 RepID=A0A285QX34_9SPHN|nr:hypothetical protein [Sphingomonas guangdongensis]SOB86483.1 hypothetical protein SAMN06297144_1588 [Sphingomonas guangdongensis]